METPRIPPSGSLVKSKPKQQMHIILKPCTTGHFEVGSLHVPRHGEVWSLSKLLWEANQRLVFCDEYCQMDHEAVRECECECERERECEFLFPRTERPDFSPWFCY